MSAAFDSDGFDAEKPDPNGAMDFVIEAGIPVTITDINGNKSRYMIVDIDGDQRDKYLNSTSQRMRYVNGKPAGVKDFKGLQSILLTMCLIKADSGEAVTMEELQAMPARITTAVFERARIRNGLDSEGDKEAGED